MIKIVSLIFLVPIFAVSQAFSSDTTSYFRIGLDVGIGYSYKLNSTNTLLGDYDRGGLAGTLRLKWGSHNIVGAGIETGWLPISSLSATHVVNELGETNIEATLNAIPVLFVVAFQRYNIQLHAGLGYYQVSAKATVFQSTIESSEWDFGYMLAAGYLFPLNSSVKIGAEVKWNNISEVQISLLSLQARLLIKLWEW